MSDFRDWAQQSRPTTGTIRIKCDWCGGSGRVVDGSDCEECDGGRVAFWRHTDEDRAALGRVLAVARAGEEWREAESIEHPDATGEARQYQALMGLIDAVDAVDPDDLTRLAELVDRSTS